MITVKIEYEYNDNEITVTRIEHIVTGKPNVEEAVRRLTDEAKAKFMAALNA